MSKPRVFRLMRAYDVSGVSGIGHVADGVTFYDGTTVLRWKGDIASTEVHECLENVLAIHGHGGATTIEWEDVR